MIVIPLIVVAFLAGVGITAALHRFHVLNQRRQVEWQDQARVRELERQYFHKPPIPWRWGSGPGWREIPSDALKYRPGGNNTCTTEGATQ